MSIYINDINDTSFLKNYESYPQSYVGYHWLLAVNKWEKFVETINQGQGEWQKLTPDGLDAVLRFSIYDDKKIREQLGIRRREEVVKELEDEKMTLNILSPMLMQCLIDEEDGILNEDGCNSAELLKKMKTSYRKMQELKIEAGGFGDEYDYLKHRGRVSFTGLIGDNRN